MMSLFVSNCLAVSQTEDGRPPLRQRLSAVFLFSKSLETIKELLPVYFNNCTGKFIPYRFVRINSASNRLLVSP